MERYKKYWLEIVIILGVSLILISSVVLESSNTIFFKYLNNYDMYSDNELICMSLGITDVLVNNVTYTCNYIMDACNVNTTINNHVMNITYDVVPFCNGIFWGG